MTTGNAEQLGELLSAYLDGELDERDSQRAASILRQDPQARQLYADLKRTRELVHALPRHAAPTSIASDVLARLERCALLPEDDAKPLVRRSRRSWWKAPLSLAAVLALFLGGWWAISLAPNGSLSPFARSARLKDAPIEGAPAFEEKSATDNRTVEAKLAAGVALASLQQHPFANEPVRLQLVVDSENERDEVMRKLSKRLASAKMLDLSTAASKKDTADAPSVEAAFFYQGQSGVNFADAESEQVLVRASPRQVQNVLKEVERVARRDDQLVLQVSTLQLPGRKSIDVLQDFADSALIQAAGETTLADASAPAASIAEDGRADELESGASRAASSRDLRPGASESARPLRADSPSVAEFDEAGAAGAADVESAKAPDEEAARFVQELLAVSGIGSGKLASAEGSRKEEAARTRPGGEAAPAPPATGGRERAIRSQPEPNPAANRESRVPAPAQPASEIVHKPSIDPENHLTFILEVRTKAASPNRPASSRVRGTPTQPAPPPRGRTRSNSFSS